MDIATHLAGHKVGPSARLQVTLVDRETAHVWKPMLHTIAAGTEEASLQQTAYLAQARQYQFVFHPGEVIEIDRAARRVRLAPWLDARGKEVLAAHDLFYDTLLLTLGSRANDFGTPGAARHCLSVDTRTQALAVYDAIRTGMLESAVRNSTLRIGIVGGGATGVELAAELVRLAQWSKFYGDTANLAVKLSVTLLESSNSILAAFPERVGRGAFTRLQKLGVTVRTGARVMQVDALGFHLKDGSQVEAEVKIWAAGVKGPDVLTTLQGLDLTHNHQVVVGPTLQTLDENIYAAGDCASVTLPGRDHALPPTAQVAHQQAIYLTKWLPRLLAGEHAPVFNYHDFGSLVSLGGYDAYGTLGKFGFFKGGFLRGRVAQLGHAMLYRSHQIRLHGLWRGSLLWLQDRIGASVRPPIRLD